MENRPRRWTLRVAGGNAAHLDFPNDGTVRVAIETATGSRFDVQLNLPHFRIKADRRYLVRFQARSDAPRRAHAGVAEAHAPWAGLGWYRDLELTPEWRTFEGEFVAAKDEGSARVHFDLGECAVPAEVRELSLRELPEGETHDAAESTGSDDTLLGGWRRLTPISRNWGIDRGLPVDRYYVENFLGRQAGDIRGRVLEIEDRIYTQQFGGGRVTATDVLHVSHGNPRATLVGDLTDAPHIPSDSFDAIILTQTLQLIFDTRATLATLRRILRPGGVLLATFPGLSKVSSREWAGSWYWGFTTASARRLFEEAFAPAPVHVEAFGNVLSAVAFLHGMAAEELSVEELEYCDPEYEVLIAVRATKGGVSR